MRRILLDLQSAQRTQRGRKENRDLARMILASIEPLRHFGFICAFALNRCGFSASLCPLRDSFHAQSGLSFPYGNQSACTESRQLSRSGDGMFRGGRTHARAAHRAHAAGGLGQRDLGIAGNQSNRRMLRRSSRRRSTSTLEAAWKMPSNRQRAGKSSGWGRTSGFADFRCVDR